MTYCDKCRELKGYVQVERPDGRGGKVSALAPCGHERGFERIDTLAHRVIDPLKESGDLPIGSSGDFSAGKSSNHQIAKSEIEQSEGIRYASARVASLDFPDREIGAIILNRRGAENPIAIAEILQILAGKWQGSEREVKAVVARLSDPAGAARLLVGVSRDAENPGYYLIENRQELDKNRAHAWKHVRAWLRRWRAFRPDRQECEEMYGQLRAEFDPQITQIAVSESAECPSLNRRTDPEAH